MRIFVTGASGFIGSAVVPELLGAGHEVVALARSDASARALAAAGAHVHRGDLEDLDGLHKAAAEADGVIHLGYVHDFSRYEEAARIDVRAIETLGAALEGSGRPLVVTAGLIGLAPGRIATERDSVDTGPGAASPRAAGTRAALALAGRGVRVSVLRLPPTVHDAGDHGFVPMLIQTARDKGVSGYVGDGGNHWSAVHRRDAARLFRLAVEDAPAGAVLHAVGEEGIAVRDIAAVIGRRLGVPVVPVEPADAAGHFGFLGAFLGSDARASGALTSRLLGWRPEFPGLLADLEAGHYFGADRA